MLQYAVFSELTVMDAKLAEPVNVSKNNVVTLFPIEILFKEVQFEKVPLSNVATPSPTTTASSLLQLANADLPILVTLSGT